jgi:Flp pilus assembly protein TadG
MKNFAFLADLSRRVSSLRRDQRGVSAVEFAMLLPLMITLWLGCEEVSKAVAIQRKVTIAARTVADLSAQVSSINNGDMLNVLKSAKAILTPYSPSHLSVTVSAVDIDANGNAMVAWSNSLTGDGNELGAGHGVGGAASIPEALKVPNSQLIWGEVNYSYTPTIGYVLTGGPYPLSDQIYMRPRLSEKVQRPTT